MSYKIITTESLILLSSQAVIFIEFCEDYGCIGLVRGDKDLDSARTITGTFDVNNAKEINRKINAAISLAKTEGLTLLENDPLEQMAKNHAVASVMSCCTEKDWEYDYLVARFNDDWSEFSCSFASVSEAYENLSACVIIERLDEEYSSSMSFARSVLKNISPKTFLLKLHIGDNDFKWVVKGTYEDAKKSLIDVANSLMDTSFTVKNFSRFVSGKVELPEKLHHVSVEEI
jgi:hypothetical protein